MVLSWGALPTELARSERIRARKCEKEQGETQRNAEVVEEGGSREPQSLRLRLVGKGQKHSRKGAVREATHPKGPA